MSADGLGRRPAGLGGATASGVGGRWAARRRAGGVGCRRVSGGGRRVSAASGALGLGWRGGVGCRRVGRRGSGGVGRRGGKFRQPHDVLELLRTVLSSFGDAGEEGDDSL
jgi:hypothetical protein